MLVLLVSRVVLFYRTSTKCRTANSGLALNSKSMLAYNGATTFYACPTGQAGGYNVYSKPVANMPDCVTIQLTATGNTCAVSTAHATVTETVTHYVTITGVCAGTAPAAAASPMLVPAAAPSPLVAPAAAPAPPTAPAAAATLPITPAAAPTPVIAPAPVVASAMPTTMATSPKPVVAVSSPPAGPLAPKTSSCPANLKGEYQAPHLIVPVDSSMPDKAYGTSYNGEANGTVSSIFNFDIPQSYAGQTCSLIFLFPKQSQLQTSSYNISGDGQLLFWLLNGYATQSTTYNNKPSHKSLLLQSNAQPGNSYIVSTGACAAGQRVAIELAATKSYALDFFQDYNPSPIGLYITRC